MDGQPSMKFGANASWVGERRMLLDRLRQRGGAEGGGDVFSRYIDCTL